MGTYIQALLYIVHMYNVMYIHETHTCTLHSIGLTEDFITTPNTQCEPVKIWVSKIIDLGK